MEVYARLTADLDGEPISLREVFFGAPGAPMTLGAEDDVQAHFVKVLLRGSREELLAQLRDLTPDDFARLRRQCPAFDWIGLFALLYDAAARGGVDPLTIDPRPEGGDGTARAPVTEGDVWGMTEEQQEAFGRAMAGAGKAEEDRMAEEAKKKTAPEAAEPKPGVMKTLEVDATDAAWRLAGSQFIKLSREPIVALLSRHLAPGDDATARAKIAAFLETEIGGALVASVLSMGLGMLPQAIGDVPQRMARELRVKAMADGGEVVAELLMGPLRQVIGLYLQGAPSQESILRATAGQLPAARADAPEPLPAEEPALAEPAKRVAS
jgi:hypothetical protein